MREKAEARIEKLERIAEAARAYKKIYNEELPSDDGFVRTRASKAKHTMFDLL